MKASIFFVFFYVSALVLLAECEEKKVEKLQIGVLKKVADCVKRAKKGDKLHMHYTVCT